MSESKRIPSVLVAFALAAPMLLSIGCCSGECFKVKVVKAFPADAALARRQVEPKPDRIRLKEGRDVAHWRVRSGKLTVTFEESPFASGEPVCIDNRCDVGPPREGTARDKPYKYKICIDGTDCRDPEVMVDH